MASNNGYYGFAHGGTAYRQLYPSSSGYIGAPNVASSYAGHGVQSYSTAQRAPASYDQSFGATQMATNYYASRPQAVAYTPDASQYSSNNTATMYPYTASTTAYTNTYNSVVSNYAATALYSQQASMNQTDNSSTAVYTSGKPSNWNFKKPIKGSKIKATPKVQQLHYCEVCKISCAGPQTYKEHLEGQRHKKKEAQMKAGQTNVNTKKNQSVGGVSLRCELCDVTCTGNDAYAAHIRGSKHQKVVKLHTRLGKPIPSTDTALVSSKNSKAIPSIPAAAGRMKVVGTPKVNFVGGGRLHTATNEVGTAPESNEDTSMSSNAYQNNSFQSSDVNSMDVDGSNSQPVGQDYVEEIKGDDNKIVSFHCKLCDCKFNDPNAKEMHLKGRRHKLQYKKKVDPSLVVDLKPSLKNRKIQETKDRRFFQKHQREQNYWSDWYQPPMGRYGYDGNMRSGMTSHSHHGMTHGGNFVSGGGPSLGGGPGGGYYRRPHGNGSWDDNHIMQKHSDICPSDNDLDEIYHVVSVTEGALKLVSDQISEEDGKTTTGEVKKDNETINSEENVQQTNEVNKDSEKTEKDQTQMDADKTDDGQTNRALKGLIRVGPLAKNLLLVNDREVDLVVICSEKPTKSLLQRAGDYLPKHLQSVSPSDTFDVQIKLEECSISISTITDPKIIVNVAFTSPLVREINEEEGESLEMVKEPKQQMLDREKCLNALAALRHAKWYQVRVVNLHPCPLIIRLLRDLCRRLPTWSPLNQWAVELLCERVISSAAEHLSPGEAFRHVLEAIASGLLLPGGAGLADPCEKEPCDALGPLTRQQREDITASAQHALRLIAFRQIHKILGVEPIKPRNRKRRHDSEADESPDVEGGDNDNKKDKKDVVSESVEPVAETETPAEVAATNETADINGKKEKVDN